MPAKKVARAVPVARTPATGRQSATALRTKGKSTARRPGANRRDMGQRQDKGQIARIFRILNLIEGGEGLSASELARRCQVSRRTIFRDLRALEQAQVPVYLHGGTHRYRLRRSFLTLPVDLSEAESLALVGTLGRLAQTAQVPMLSIVQRALEKIRGQLSPPTLQKLEALEARLGFQLSGVEDQQQYHDVFVRLQQAIEERRVLLCRYQPLKRAAEAGADADPLDRGATQAFELRPYGLFWRHGASYVIGHHSGRDALRTLRLSRFLEVEMLARTYRIPEAFDLQTFLGNAWGIMRGPQRYDVKLRFSGAAAAIVDESQWHRTQQTQALADGSLSFRCQVDGLEEITRWILSFGQECTVLEPAELAKGVRDAAAAIVAKYAGLPNEPSAAPAAAVKG